VVARVEDGVTEPVVLHTLIVLEEDNGRASSTAYRPWYCGGANK
jgi:hypothetical protein